ncbi:DNA polymerase ligase N-terminal domain-containing protein [Paraburkholderia ferrariae]|uniref:DNA polymerase ligase N-terminal domain-containing protein n=1 Tax=Paraburkholderia ferrariae TaxID=386056 RepID=A0ABU9RMG9_9BURK
MAYLNDPTKAKRMAVHVENHPFDYASFEGTIPAKQYGAGTVIVWDRGAWEPVGDPGEGMKSAKLVLCLQGEKLKSLPACGSWYGSGNPATVKTSGRSSRSATNGPGCFPGTTSSRRFPTAWSRTR